MSPEPKAEALLQREIARLERFFPRIQSCSVTIEAPVRRAPFKVRIDVIGPSTAMIVRHSPTLHRTLAAQEAAKTTKQAEPARSHLELERAIRDAFSEMRRRLQDHLRHMRGDIKRKEPRAGHVTSVVPAGEHGYLETPDGRTLYFHANAVLNGHFDDLRVGSEVFFEEEVGERGPQASTVRLAHPGRQLPKAAGLVLVEKPRKKAVLRGA